MQIDEPLVDDYIEIQSSRKSSPYLCKEEDIEMKQPQDSGSEDERDDLVDAQVPYIDTEENLFNPIEEVNEPQIEKDPAKDLVDVLCRKDTQFKEWLTGTRDMTMRQSPVKRAKTLTKGKNELESAYGVTPGAITSAKKMTHEKKAAKIVKATN